ncbi:Glyoxalase/bleomycin resistance protein/dioxygenase [Galbibacter marinus]|uniref:Glyoxalase/bleomycin resistance protein/dioxygenase n=2 Tax=Galbibacter marinus TaxID=555500 RepID=K2QHF8_9FLAO|nr:Glyoxalase/bleomycin resistance protein/dioxygenase [Galbibacter marinus]
MFLIEKKKSQMDTQKAPYSIPSQTRIGHIHLKVADMERSLKFYCGLLGFKETSRHGSRVVFISAGGYHQHIALNTWYSKNGKPPLPNNTGLSQVSILYPTRRDLACILKRILDANYTISGASDHGVSENLYIEDPDKNVIALYWDKPYELWPFHKDGTLEIYNVPLNITELLETTSR